MEKKGWKTAAGKPVLNQDLWETLDQLNSQQVKWQYVRGHAGNVGNERCDAIANTFANGRTPPLQQNFLDIPNISDEPNSYKDHIPTAGISNVNNNSTIVYPKGKQLLQVEEPVQRTAHQTQQKSHLVSDINMMDTPAPSSTTAIEELPRELRVAQLRNLVETLRIADEIAAKGYLITSSELADLMDVHASAVTSRGDEWRWRNWIVSRVRREGNQILWELERADSINPDQNYNSDPATE